MLYDRGSIPFELDRAINTVAAGIAAGMEPEILSSIFSAIRPPSPPFVSSVLDVSVVPSPARQDGILYVVQTKNFEWGSEGIRTPSRTECEAIMGLKEPADPNAPNWAKVAAVTIGAALAGGLNQHRLAHQGKLAATKRATVQRA